MIVPFSAASSIGNNVSPGTKPSRIDVYKRQIQYRNLDPIQLAKWNKKRALLKIEQPDFNLSPCEILLSNGKNEVLNSYNLLDSEMRKKLIEHVAFLITKK